MRKLEEMNQKILQHYESMDRKHSERYEALSKEFQGLQRHLQQQAVPVRSASTSGMDLQPGAPDDRRPSGPEGTIGRGSAGDQGAAGAAPSAPGGGMGTPGGGAPDDRRTVGPEGTIGRGSAGDQEGGGAGGTGGDRVGAAPYGAKGRGPEAGGAKKEKDRPVKVTIGNGLRFDSEDEEFQLQFHDLTQAEIRNFPGVGNQSPLKTQFFIPRQRWYFTGRATKNVEFYTVINRGYGSLDLLDAFLNFNFDPRIQFRAGRTKTPTSYEYYQIAEGDLIAPERSLFIGNLAGNRQDGFMFHGQIQDKRAEWAVGVFNGPRRSFSDFNSDKDLYLFYNVRPFQKSETLKALHYMNFGGAYNFGTENNPLQPNVLTTANDETSLSNDPVVQSLSPTFFKFNSNVMENGGRAQWAGWIMWFWNSFNVLAEYDGGFQDYSLTTKSTRTHVPLEGFSTTVFYFVTGEQITRRVDIQPLKDFAFKNGAVHRPWRHRDLRPLQRPEHRQQCLHRRPGRPQPLDQPGLCDRHRAELVPEPVHEDLHGLAARRLRQPRLQRPGRPHPEDQPALAAIPALLLIRSCCVLQPMLSSPRNRNGVARRISCCKS